ncbi:MAG: DNA-3-methyladenine glycosylase [Ornithinimicrobium sp.]
MDDLSIRRTALAGAVTEVAADLLGTHLRHGEVLVRISEVEAYGGADDPGSHAFRGPTPRSQIMFEEAGTAYVYFSYGMHHCLNVVSGPSGAPGAVLIRGGQVLEGEDVARRRRDRGRGSPHPHRDLARGPARLASALGVDLQHNGVDLCDPRGHLRLEDGVRVGAATISAGPRVGVSGPGGDGTTYPWRFWITGDPSVSPYRAAAARRSPRPG